MGFTVLLLTGQALKTEHHKKIYLKACLWLQLKRWSHLSVVRFCSISKMKFSFVVALRSGYDWKDFTIDHTWVLISVFKLRVVFVIDFCMVIGENGPVHSLADFMKVFPLRLVGSVSRWWHSREEPGPRLWWQKKYLYCLHPSPLLWSQTLQVCRPPRHPGKVEVWLRTSALCQAPPGKEIFRKLRVQKATLHRRRVFPWLFSCLL